MDLETVILSEVTQTEKKTNIGHHLHLESKRYPQTHNIIKKETHGSREQTSGYQWEEGRGGAIYGRQGRGTNCYA